MHRSLMNESALSKGLHSPDRAGIKDSGQDYTESPTTSKAQAGRSVKIPRRSGANKSALANLQKTAVAEGNQNDDTMPSPHLRSDEKGQRAKSFKVSRVDFVRGKIPTNN